MNKTAAKKGFTLIELLIVIGILAILATVTLLVLNPAQMFAQARDSQRISDLNTIKTAISLYMSTISSPTLGTPTGGSDLCGTKFWGTIGTTSTTLFPGSRAFVGATATTSVDSTGWVPVPLSSMSGGSPIATLPLDPSNISGGTVNSNTNVTTAYYYTCSTTQLTFKLVGNMESTAYANGGTNDKESTDGGTFSGFYETGTNLGNSL